MPEEKSPQERLKSLAEYTGKVIDVDAEVITAAIGLLTGDIKIDMKEAMCPTSLEERMERMKVLHSHLQRAPDLPNFPIYQDGKEDPMNMNYPGNVIRAAAENLGGVLKTWEEQISKMSPKDKEILSRALYPKDYAAETMK